MDEMKGYEMLTVKECLKPYSSEVSFVEREIRRHSMMLIEYHRSKECELS